VVTSDAGDADPWRAPEALEEGSQGKREARSPWIEIQETKRAPEVGVDRLRHHPRAPPARARSFTVRDPGAARPDGSLHLATFLSRLRRATNTYIRDPGAARLTAACTWLPSSRAFGAYPPSRA